MLAGGILTARTTFRQHGEYPHPTPVLNEIVLPLELLSLPLSPVYYGLGIPHGDGSAVVLIPGLAGLDQYLLPMHMWLCRIGYRPYLSKVGSMADCPQKLSQKLDQTIRRAFAETGRRRVHLIGYSLGGIFARSAAVRRPKQIASVTSLGSPFRGLVAHEIVFTVGRMVRRLIHVRNEGLPKGCGTSRCPCAFGQSLTGQWPKSVRQTAIYSPSDGLVDWRHCLTGREGVDVEVQATHLGMPFNMAVYEQIALRLALSAKTGPKRPRTNLAPRA
jgi:pimeloyl-ACP methyl ester carboxylesterase